MSLRERMRLEEIESDSLLKKPQWHVKEEENEADLALIADAALVEDKKAPLCK